MSKRKEFEKKKKFIQELLNDPIYKPMRLREIASLLQLSKEQKKELYDVLEELVDDGKAWVDNKGRYSKYSKKNKEHTRIAHPRREEGTYVEGLFIGHAKGFGFVEVEGLEEDIFIPEDKTGTAMHHDQVQVLLQEGRKEGKRQEGTITKILERGMTEVVGTYQSSRDYGFVISDNPKFSKDIFIPKKESKGVKNGDKVVVTLTDYGSKNKSPEGKIKENLGNIRMPGTDILAIVKSFGIPSEFPDRVQKQADRVPDHVLDADRDGRIDLCHLPTVTIDGEDAG